MMDPSEQCGYTLEAQRSLFENIKPLFANKPIIAVANKADIWRDSLTEDKRSILEGMKDHAEVMLEMSTKDDDSSIMSVKTKTCDVLLQHRVEQKFQSRKVGKMRINVIVSDLIIQLNFRPTESLIGSTWQNPPRGTTRPARPTFPKPF